MTDEQLSQGTVDFRNEERRAANRGEIEPAPKPAPGDQETIVLHRSPLSTIDPDRRVEDRVAFALLKFGFVAGFLALEAIVLLAIAEILGVR